MFEKFVLSVLMDAVRPGWRERKARRKSLWHLPKIVLMFALLLGLWFVLFKLMWQVHLFLHPSRSETAELVPRGVHGIPLVASLLERLPLSLPALGLSLVATNLLFWLIPRARRVFEREAEGDPEMTFRGATGKLLRITLLFLLPIGLGLSLLGAWTSNLR